MTIIKPTESAESKTFRLSPRVEVVITVGTGGMVCEWTPDIGDLTPQELTAYREARAEMLIRLAKMTGGTVACVEI